ncbi:MAG: DUF4266 domain-containing protein [Candidatus Latescibacteria bacterium]|nr:DUF4266 domain-containing protein [Candidatus Latescibacterota bacterium]
MLQGCAAVKPWERSYLATEPMLLDESPLADDHLVFEAREGSAGGSAVGGGGCACKR